MRTGIAAIPDGRYRFEDVLDDDGLKERDVKFALSVEKTGERIVFDFTGSSPQVPGNVNLTLNAVQSAVCYALKALLDPELPNNQAAIDAVEIVAPAGTVANCVAPAAVALRANTCQRVIDVVIGALADVLPGEAIGAANGANTSMVFAGVDPRNGAPYVYLGDARRRHGRPQRPRRQGRRAGAHHQHVQPAGRGDRDGVSAARGGVRAGRRTRAVRAASAAAWGCGAACDRSGTRCEFNGVGERFRHAPWGIFGGEPGARGRFQLQAADGAQSELPPKTGRMELAPDQVVIVETPGAGGYGPASAREAADIDRDRRSGKFTDDYLRRYYRRTT